jgi:hypothetical protein
MNKILRGFLFFSVLALVSNCAVSSAPTRAETTSVPEPPRSFQIRPLGDSTGETIPIAVRDEVARSLARALRGLGFVVPTQGSQAQAALDTNVLSCAEPGTGESIVRTSAPECIVAVTVTETGTSQVVIKFVVETPPLQGPALQTSAADAAGQAIADEVAAELKPPSAHPGAVAEDISAGGTHVTYQGNGIFLVGSGAQDQGGNASPTVIDLKHIRHAYDPTVDKDVPTYTNVTLDDIVPPFTDESGREYALITLYQIDPPLVSQASKEAGINRGTDFRDPSNLVKGAYSNYVSPVFTNDREQRRVASHPIGHFYVKVEIPGYPTVLTGMTTIARADTELANLTVGRDLGIGGVLLTPEPGRLNAATEALQELMLRQRELRIVDGLYFRSFLGRNTGPEYIVTNGNVVFARFKVPVKNAEDAMAFFVEFLARGEQNIFGSLLNRPERGTGSGCTPFAISWLEASGVIPFMGEPANIPLPAQPVAEDYGARDFWEYVHRTIYIPWSQIGCDERLGVDGVIPAQYTIFDLLFHNLSRAFLREASQGLAAKIKRDYGVVAGTLFQFGALTPLRDLVVSSRRKDAQDRGNYAWGTSGEGLKAPFWDNARFSAWVKSYRAHPRDVGTVAQARDGRFEGIAFDAMTAGRQSQPFFAEADAIAAKKQELARAGARPRSCKALFTLDIQ